MWEYGGVNLVIKQSPSADRQRSLDMGLFEMTANFSKDQTKHSYIFLLWTGFNTNSQKNNPASSVYGIFPHSMQWNTSVRAVKIHHNPCACGLRSWAQGCKPVHWNCSTDLLPLSKIWFMTTSSHGSQGNCAFGNSNTSVLTFFVMFASFWDAGRPAQGCNYCNYCAGSSCAGTFHCPLCRSSRKTLEARYWPQLLCLA